jgi:N-acetylglucosaminyl-diphospho-decaprenol L-rhamnosyltransferase
VNPQPAHGDGPTAVVVAHNSGSTIAECLASLEPLGIPVVVVDSGSTDDSSRIVAQRFAHVRYVRVQNAGFGAACNAGIACADTPLVLLLNADAWPTNDAVEVLCRALCSDPDTGAVGPQLVDRRGRRHRSVVGQPMRALELAAFTLFPSLTRATFLMTRRVRGFRPRSGAAEVRGREFLMGAALLVRRAALDAVGAFDTSFFMYDEDVDLCWRLRLGGWAVRFVPEATFVHVGGASTSPVAAAMFREQIRSHVRLLAKYRGAEAADRGRRGLALALAVRSLVERGGRRRECRAIAEWLAATSTASLLAGRETA